MPASGGGGGGGTFNGGTITGALDIKPSSDTLPLQIEAHSGGASELLDIKDDLGNSVFVVNAGGSTSILPIQAGTEALSIQAAGNTETVLDVTNHSGSVEFLVNGTQGVQVFATGKPFFCNSGVKTNPLTSGALPTVAPVSATAFQCSTTRDVFLTVPVTYNPGAATTATCKVELSPDNVTFSELVTITQPVGTVFDGSIEAVQLMVPAGWRVKLTVTNATLGTGTYY